MKQPKLKNQRQDSYIKQRDTKDRTTWTSMKSGALKGYEFPAAHAAHVMMSPMSYQGMKRTHDNSIMVYRCY